MFETTNQVIEKRFQDNWVGTKVDYENMPFTPVRGVSHVKLRMEWADSQNISVGGLRRGEGLIYVSVFIPVNGGSTEAMQLADQARLIYENQEEGHVTFGAAFINRVGEGKTWYQLNVLIPFKADECT